MSPRKFNVPPPPTEEVAGPLATKEVVGFEKDDSEMWRGKWPRNMFHGLRFALFIFALGINIWWDNHVLDILWQAGRTGTGFHLSDSVLIALVTTSVANFLALVGIIARDLFSGRRH